MKKSSIAHTTHSIEVLYSEASGQPMVLADLVGVRKYVGPLPKGVRQNSKGCVTFFMQIGGPYSKETAHATATMLQQGLQEIFPRARISILMESFPSHESAH